MPDINLSPYTAESAAIARKMRLAEALQQQALSPIEMPTMAGVAISPYAGLAKMLQAYSASRMRGKAEEREKTLADTARSDISADFSSLLKGLTPTALVPEGPSTFTANVDQRDIAENPRMVMQPERNEMNEIIQPGEAGAGNFGVTPGTPAIPASAGRLTAEGFGAMRTPTGQQQYMAQLLAQMKPKEPIKLGKDDVLFDPVTLKPIYMPEARGNFGSINPSQYTPESIKAFMASGSKNFGVLVAQPNLSFQNTGTTIQAFDPRTGVAVGAGAPINVSPNTAASLAQARLLSDREFNGLSANQRAQLENEAARRNISAQQLFFDTGLQASGGARLPPPVTPSAATSTGAPAVPAAMPAPSAQPVVAQPAPAMPVAARPAAAMPAPAAPMSTVAAAPTTAAATGPIINQVTPKERQKLLLEQPQAQVSATTQMQNLDRFMAGAKELETHPGLESITGKVGQFSTFDVSEESRAARALQNTVIKQSATRALQDMREASKTGGAVGAVSQGEWPILEQQIAALDGAQDAAQYKTALQNLQSQLKTSRDRIQNAYEATYGPLKYTAPEYKKQELKKSSGWSVVN